MNKLKRTKTDKGITLIALIITIIVLLILAIVAIRAVTGDGIIQHAQNAQRQYQREQALEEINLELNEWEIVKRTQEEPDLKTFLEEKFGNVEEVDGNYIVTVRGFQATINSEGKLVGELIDVEGETEDAETPEETLPISITLDKTEITAQITSGSTPTETIIATLNNATGYLTWESSDTSVAEISGNGNIGTITLKKEGTATITVSYSEYSATCTIEVEYLPISVSLDKTEIATEITSGSTATETITATLTNATGDLTWKSSNASIAEISGNGNTGTVTLKKAGTATITVSYGEYTATCKVTVTEKIPTVADSFDKVLSTTENITVEDEYGNKIVVPAGFKITTDVGHVTEGIVIEDATYEKTKGSQFVWVPIGNVYTTTDETKTEENTKTIELKRYVFNSSGEIDETLTKTQPSDQLKITSSSTYYWIEGLKNSTTKNAHAKDIEAFITSAKSNGGYYIGRYEARKSANNVVTTVNTNTVYGSVSQSEASSLSQGMYINGNFTSDLVNSYAWDTTIVFLQMFDDREDKTKPYSMQNSLNTTYSTTGTTTDKICNVYDMASNCWEWTTELYNKESAPCSIRGGMHGNSTYNASTRNAEVTYYTGYWYSFRPVIYF